jgi:hypothetical protein
MAVPTDGTKVFAMDTRYSAGSNPAYRANFPVDMDLVRVIDGTSSWSLQDRLRGKLRLITNSTDAESAWDERYDFNNGWGEATSADPTRYSWMWGRAPGFFDEVCYTGTGATQNIPHNLTVKPELWIVKRRNASAFWPVWVNGFETYEYMDLSSSGFKISDGPSNQSFISNSTQLTIQTAYSSVNASGGTYVAYLFASAPGVSKVGSYTGTGALQTVNCGFTTGARFVLIKRTDSTGDWFTYDSSRGITSGNDPYLLMNSSAAEVTGTNYVDTTSVGFQVTAAAPAGLNASGGTYIFLAIA